MEVETYGIDMLEELSKYIFTSKYARYNEKLKRRETWHEAVGRLEKMHLNKFNYLDQEALDELKWACDMVRDRKIFPSMRSLQFGGAAIESKNERGYNCCVRHIDSIRSFSEVFYLLLCGCGVGVGLTNKFLSRLPGLVGPNDRTGTVVTYVVEDSIEGWADSIEALLNCYFINTAYSGRSIKFDFSKIRKKGSKLKTSGGKAPGYEGLKAALSKIKYLLDSIIEEQNQRRLKTINAYDILMHCSDAVLSGGIRRSAMSVLFSYKDKDMLMAKTNNWFETNPQRARSNNSVMLLRDKLTLEVFKDIIQFTQQWGEPAFVFVDNEDVLFNPCFEISFIPITSDGICGVQMCNLTSINMTNINSLDEFKQAAKAATIIGTIQASYTDFPYLSKAAEQLTREEALLGVSMTAMMDKPHIALNPAYQQEVAHLTKHTNERWASKININPAARITAIKPEGTSTLVGKSMASGHHASHAKIMFRRVQANKLDNVYQFFKQYNEHMTEESVWSANKTDDIITWPIKLDNDVIVKADLTALQHLESVLSTQKNWVQTGTTKYNKKPIHHNVSSTIIVKDNEWNEVIQFIFDNRYDFTAVSLIAATGDKDFQQAPNEAVINQEDFDKFNYYIKNYIPIDYTYLQEQDDQTHHMAEAVCAGGACEIR